MFRRSEILYIKRHGGVGILSEIHDAVGIEILRIGLEYPVIFMIPHKIADFIKSAATGENPFDITVTGADGI